MSVRSFTKHVLPIAAIAALASCCSEGTKGTPDGGGCECSSADDNYCNNADNAMQCSDGCHFTEQDCECADCNYCCTDGECYPHDCDGENEPDCEDEHDNFCDGTILFECQTFPNEWNNFYQTVECYDPENCECGSGCSEEGEFAECWCCQSDGGVPDAG
jgi:hypothetical protein